MLFILSCGSSLYRLQKHAKSKSESGKKQIGKKMTQKGLFLLCHFSCVAILESELGADGLDLKLELVAAYKLDLMHVDVEVVAYGAPS